jgi:two-component system, NtrC family, sensor kinase
MRTTTRIVKGGPTQGNDPGFADRIDLPASAIALRENHKMVTIGRLAGSIAHEINNPLESITNLMFLIGNDHKLSAESRNYLQMAQHELNRVIQISKQTLNFYRETPAPVRADMVELLEEVLVLYARRIGEKQLLVMREYDARTPVTVFPGEMRQVFSNLISNAIEASRTGGKLRLRVRSATHWIDGGVRGVRISIADDGSGIDPQIRARLGEPFFTTKGQSGTGLGLWVTQSILNRYGGDMRLHSSIGDRHGTVFSIFLPTNLRPTILHPPHGAGHGESREARPEDETFEDSRDPGSKDPSGEEGEDRNSGAA